MVDVSNKQNSTVIKITSSSGNTNITASSSGNTANANVTPDYTKYYSEKSKEWAISDKIIDNADYSSKYYANESKKQADISTAKATEVVESGNTALLNIETAKSNALNNINTTGAEYVNNAEQYAQNALNSANNAEQYAQNALNSANNAKTSEDNALSYKNSAMESSQTATEQASIATTNANKAITSATNAKTSETNAKSSETRCEEILSRLGTAIKVKGRVNSLDDLPLSGNLDGDTYLIGEEGLDSYPEYYWYQDHWEFLGTSGSSLSWGLITGNISAQADLQNALNGKLSTTGTADKALKDSNGLQINTNYMRRTIGDAGIPATPTAPTALAMVGKQACGNGNIAGGNLVALHKNTLFRCYERGSTITCNYEDKVANLGKTMCDGSFSGYYTQINPSTSFTSKPFVWQVTSPTQYEVSDVCRLHIYSHRLSDALNVTAFKIEAYIQDTLTNSKKWITAYEYAGASKNIAQTGFGLYKTGYSSNPYYSIFGIRLTISGSPDTVFKMSQVQIVASRGTETLADSLQCVSNAGGKIWGNLEVTGTLKSSNTYTKTEVDNITDNKVDLDGGNYKGSPLEEYIHEHSMVDKITNCLLEVPQNIKLELNDGTLTLKAGSKVIVPNGAGVFGEVVTLKDLSTTGYHDGKIMVLAQLNSVGGNNIVGITEALVSKCTSGSTNPTAGVYYNISSNTICRYTNSVVDIQFALPLAICTRTSGVITSIDQVFNGMGYIGSTVWVDKGVKGLIPNGRNEDGSLNNIEFETSKVATYTSTTSFTGEGYLCLNSSSIDRLRSTAFYYDTLANLNKYTNGTKIYYCFCGFVSLSNDAITSFQPNKPFRAVDYNDFKKLHVNNPYFFGQYIWSEFAPSNLSWLKSSGQWNSGSGYQSFYDWALANANANKAGFKLSTASYTDYDFVVNTSAKTFRLPIKVKNLPMGTTAPIVALNINSSTLVRRTGTGELQNGYQSSGGTGMNSANGGRLCIEGARDNEWHDIYLDPNGTLKADLLNATLPDLHLYFYVGETVRDEFLIDVAQIASNFADKIGRTECKAYITETYVNGTSWYRVWSDGWCEQGGGLHATADTTTGVKTITFLKPFVNANYTFTCHIGQNNSDNISYYRMPYDKTATGFTYNKLTNLVGGWYACGYIS